MNGGRAMQWAGFAGRARLAVPGGEGLQCLGVEMWTLNELRRLRGRLP